MSRLRDNSSLGLNLGDYVPGYVTGFIRISERKYLSSLSVQGVCVCLTGACECLSSFSISSLQEEVTVNPPGLRALVV